MVQWRFPSNDHGEVKGFNDSGVAQFRGTPLPSLAREICQNSLDAAREKTVVVEFNAFDLPSSKLPGAVALRDVFERCVDFWKNQKSITTRNFFKNAYEKIGAETIHMLRISDYNTSGLTGSRGLINTNWTNLTKSSGVSDKRGAAGGSFGIGKFAPFACSDFSAVYYSTYDEEELEASQGVARLVTFTREDNEDTQGVGYFGEERNTPAFAQMNLEPGYQRKPGQYGTDIYIAGYKYTTVEGGWEKSIIVSILESFLGAIWDEKLVVKVGQYEISKESLNDIIEMFREELTGYTERYYEVLTSSATVWHEEADFMGLGKVKLGLLLGGQEMHRKIAMIRKTGMKIMDQDRISSFIPFAGIMFIEGDKLNERLRALENPEHTEWQVARADNEVQARALLKSIRDFLCRKVEALASQGGQDDFDVAGLSNLLPDDPDSNSDAAKEENVTDATFAIEKHKPKKKSAQTAGANAGGTEGIDFKDGGYVEGGSVLGYLHKGGHTKHPGEKDPYPVDVDINAKGKIPEPRSVVPQKLRIVCMDKSAGKYAVMFVPNADASRATIKLSLAAETTNYPAPIVEASIVGRGALSVKNGVLSGVELKKDVPVRIMIKLDYYDYCSMEVSAYAD